MNYLLPRKLIEQNVIALGKTGAGKSSALRRAFVEPMLTEHIPTCILDPKGDWWGLKLSKDGRHPGYDIPIFGGRHADIPITPDAGAAIGELWATGNWSCILDLRGWMPGERGQFFVGFASALYDKNVGRRWVVMDECHNFAPKGKVLDPQAGKSLHWANKLASEGRGLGINLIGASQRPQKVHNDFLTSCETLVAMRVLHASDREAYKDWIDGCGDPKVGKEMLAAIANLKRGMGYVWAPEYEFGPELVTFPMFETYDSFKPQEPDTKLTGWAEVDLESLQSKLKTVIDEATENDPGRLKKRIRELEAERKGDDDWNPDAIERARTEGYDHGYRTGYGDAAAAAKLRTDNLLGAIQSVISTAVDSHTILPTPSAFRRANPGLDDSSLAMKYAFEGAKRKDPFRVNETGTIIGVDFSSGPDRTAIGTGQGEKLKAAERALLTVCAQKRSVTKVQLSILSGYSIRSSSFSNALGALRSKGYVEKGEPIRITDIGLKALGSYEPLPSGRQLIEHWMGQLKQAERELLRVVVRRGSVSKEQLSKESNYSATSSSFSNALGRLRSLELVERGDPIRLSDSLS